MTVKFQRPSGAYAGAAGLANRTKYQDDAGATPKRAISSAKVDGDVNYLVDAVNETWDAVASASFASALPTQTGFANCVPVTNGTAAAWQLVTNANVQDGTLSVAKLAPMAANSVLGAGASGVPNVLTLGAGLSVVAGQLVGSSLPAGLVVPFAGSASPEGWLLCAGQAVSCTTFAALFAAVGVLYGAGDCSTTFNVPDLRGRAVFGKDDMNGSAAARVTSAVSGVAGATLGGSGGSQQMQQHTHAVNDPGHVHGTGLRISPFALANGGGGFPPINDMGGLNTLSATTGITLANTGSGSSQNMPPALVLNYLIKT